MVILKRSVLPEQTVEAEALPGGALYVRVGSFGPGTARRVAEYGAIGAHTAMPRCVMSCIASGGRPVHSTTTTPASSAAAGDPATEVGTGASPVARTGEDASTGEGLRGRTVMRAPVA